MTSEERLKKLEKRKPSDFVWIACIGCGKIGYTRVSFLKSKEWYCSKCNNKKWKFWGKKSIALGIKNQDINGEITNDS
jgi:hypothetical protein